MTLKSTPSKRLRLAVVSDIHLGQPNVPAKHIVDNLSYYLDDDLLSSLDMLVLAGDIFDRLLVLNDSQIFDIDWWIINLLKTCKKHDVALFVLDGTKSHDRDQLKRFVHFNEELTNIGAELYYVKELSIRYVEKFDMNFLFVPDEWHHDPNETLKQVYELLELKNLTQVDYAFMHGNFHYQLPEIVKSPKHDERAYLKIVKHLIFIGHIHTRSQFERIYAQGSFDRLRHGEEEAKGFYVSTLYDNDTYEVNFIENTRAMRFVTVNCSGLSVDETINKARLVAEKLPNGSFIRLTIERNNPISKHMHLLITEFPLLKWSTKELKEEKESSVMELQRDLDYQPVYITPDNVEELIKERLEPKGLTEPERLSIKEELRKLVKGVLA